MNPEEQQPPEEIYVPEQPVSKQDRGYFFYIAIFFILIALLCYLLETGNVSGTLPVPSASTQASPTAPSH